VLQAVRSAALPSSWLDAPPPSQGATTTTAGSNATIPPTHRTIELQQQQQQQQQQVRLDPSCTQHMLAALLDCLHLDASPSLGHRDNCAAAPPPSQQQQQQQRQNAPTSRPATLWHAGRGPGPSTAAPSLTFPYPPPFGTTVVGSAGSACGNNGSGGMFGCASAVGGSWHLSPQGQLQLLSASTQGTQVGKKALCHFVRQASCSCCLLARKARR